MSVPPTAEEFRAAHPSLTGRQLATALLYERGLGLAAIGRTLGVSRATARDHLDAAVLKIGRESPWEAAGAAAGGARDRGPPARGRA